MAGKVYSFKDENGCIVKYTVKEHLAIGKNEYVIMVPENDTSHMEAYRFSNEALELVEDSDELSKVKNASFTMK